MSRINFFKLWMEYMGFNQKEVAKAGQLIGHQNRVSTSKRLSGAIETTETERLAMSARVAGLKPWTPSYHSHLVAVKSITELIDEKAGKIKPDASAD